MKVIDGGIVVASRSQTDRQSCAFPNICVLPGGRWICGFRAAPTKAATTGQHALITWSDDQGRTWSEPIAPFVPPKVEGKPGLFRAAYLTAMGCDSVLAALCWVDHSDPSLPFFNDQTEGLLDTRIFLARSEDAGATWSEPRIVDTSPFNIPTAITGPVLRLADGRLACQFELNKHYYDTSVWRHSSVMIFSDDDAQTWGQHVITSNDPKNRIFYWDQRPSVLSDGILLDLFWTYDNQTAKYLNIHARQSLDNGRTFSEIWDTHVPSQPGPPVSTPDGEIAMVYVDRTGEPIVKVRKSADGGITWPEETEIILYQATSKSQTWRKQSMQDAWAEMGQFSVGLPATATVGNGDILVVYYAGCETDRTDIRWDRISV